MTFLTANYGLSPEQINAYYDAYRSAYYQMGAEIEYSWEESGWTPDNPEEAMIECLCDADRLEQYLDDYMDWCFDFKFKQELIYDIEDRHMPQYFQEYLESQGKTSWSCWALDGDTRQINHTEF